MNRLLILLGVLLIVSCSNNSSTKKSEAIKDSTTIETSEVDSMCYMYTNNHKDTVAMRIININGKISGTLTYNYFEKDRNTGTLTGSMYGDTLVGDYQFMSEGVQSVREVAFIKKDNAWLQGYGEMVEKASKMEFADKNKLIFDTVNKLLQRKNCD